MKLWHDKVVTRMQEFRDIAENFTSQKTGWRGTVWLGDAFGCGDRDVQG